MNPPLKVGIVAASSKSLGELSRIVQGAGFGISASLDAIKAVPEPLPEADVWVVDLDLEKDSSQALMNHLDDSGIPVIFDEDAAEINSELSLTEQRLKREKRLAEKIRELAQPSHLDELPRASSVWVLAASTGGPEAVAAFLAEIPLDLSHCAFIYAQHTETSAVDNLCQVISRRCSWQVKRADACLTLREKTVYVVSPEYQVHLSDSGILSPTEIPWSGHYKPSIDQVIAKVARVYGRNGGAIVFSGMGDDGANSCTLLHHRGGSVWIQSRSSCAVDSMPDAVEKRGCSVFSGEPAQLAKQFIHVHKSGAHRAQS